MFRDGRFYKGQFVNDSIKGKGIFRLSAAADSIIIEANFEDDVIIAGSAKI